MSTFKKAEVIMLPTNKPSKLGNLATYKGKSLAKVIKEGVNLKNTTVQFWNLYIISDDEIKEGDWCYDLKNNCTLQAKSSYEGMRIKKIIATTDTSLNLPQPSQQFIEKYIEEYNRGNVITDVLVEYNCGDNHCSLFGCQKHLGCKNESIQSIKINLKDNTITIKKVKDSWNREEVENLIYAAMKDRCYTTVSEWDKWIEENL